MWVVYQSFLGRKRYWTGSGFMSGRENALELSLDEASRIAAQYDGFLEVAWWAA